MSFSVADILVTLSRCLSDSSFSVRLRLILVPKCCTIAITCPVIFPSSSTLLVIGILLHVGTTELNLTVDNKADLEREINIHH